MRLSKHYDQLWSQALQKFEAGQFQYDHLIDSSEDTRYGITLLTRPSGPVKQAISDMLEKIKAVAPDQYYYPTSDIHLTVLSIISCYPGFSTEGIHGSAYSRLIRPALSSIEPFAVRFEGLTASPSCIMIRGFPENNMLNRIRDKLREKFGRSDIPHSVDKRYRIHTAHSTVVRFKQELSDPDAFVEKIKSLRTSSFGMCQIRELELVANDWYQRKDRVKLLDTFKLKAAE